MDYEIETNEAVSEAVVLAVSAIQGRDPTSLPPLREVLDPDSLDSIFDRRFDGVPREGGRVTFTYANCHIRIDNGEYLTIEPMGSEEARPERADLGPKNTI